MTDTPPPYDEELDAALAACATYGTDILSRFPDDLEHYIAGFKHSRTYTEAKAALTALLLRARQDELFEVPLYPAVRLAKYKASRHAALQQQLKEVERKDK